LGQKADGDLDGNKHSLHHSATKTGIESEPRSTTDVQIPEYIIRCRSTFKLYWDIFIIILALYNSIIIPVEIAFNPEDLNKALEITIEASINMIFMIDIILTFRITYVSITSGDEIFDPKQIAKNYLLGPKMILDILSSIPFNAIDPTANILPLLGMLKLIRVGRITDVIRNLNSRAENKAGLRVLWLIFFVFLYIHLMACLWNMIVTIDEEWIPTKDAIFGGEF
jgi:hypothetical protein